MIIGLLLITFGVLIAVFPQLLVALISGLFIMAGAIVCLISWQWRRMRRSPAQSITQWFFRA